MAEKRKKGVDGKVVNRVLVRLGLDSTSQSSRAQRRAGDERDAQRLAGDERDAQRIAHLREKFKDAPEFLTVPMSKWDEKMTAAAENDPCDALAILRAIRRRVPGVSYRLLKIIWLLRQPGFCDEFRELSDLDDNGALRYDAFRGADSLEESASVFLPDGFLNFEDFSGGGFYLTTLAAVCGVDVGVVEDGLRAFEKKSKAKKREKKSKAAATLTEDNDEILIKAAREGLEAARKRVANFPYSGIVGGEGRDHWTRYKEKAMSEQLFGRFGRELVRAAIAELDVESMSEDEIVAAVKTKLAVHNRVFMSEPLFIALALEGGDAYHGEGWITAIARDVEGMAAGLTGGMIETGGLNVAHLGSEAKRVPGRTETYTDGHLAFSFMRDIAFAEAKGGDAAAFDVAYERVKKLLAKDVFSRDQRMMQRLAKTSVHLLEENGLDVLAKADAETWRPRRECPTYDTIDAGTFARALAAGDGRKGGAAIAKLVLEFKDPKVTQSREDERKAKNVLMIDPTPDEKEAHIAAIVRGGGCAPGGFSTPAERDAHAVAIVRGTLRKRGLLPQGPVLTDGNSAGVAEDNPAGAHRGDAPCAASDPAAPDHPAGDGARRGKRKRFNGKKKDPTSVRGARWFIELGVSLICSVCETEAASQWYGNLDDPKKPVCRPCNNRQLAATRGDCADCGIAGADASIMLKSRFTDGAWLCKKCWDKEAPADRVCASCDKGVDTVKSWHKSKLIEGAPWLCNPCFKREATQILTDAGTTCGKCGSSKASSWHNSPDVPGGKVCMKCWHEANPTIRKKKKQ